MTRDLDWGPLVAPGVAALLAVALLAAVWHFTGAWRDDRHAEFTRARAELDRAASRYRNASDDQEVYAQYAARFRDMSERGWIGPEQRLGWIEALQGINEELKLPTLRYDIERQRVVDRHGSDRLVLHRTPMRLSFGALHEGDVVNLFARLRAEADGLLAVHGCDLARQSDSIRLDGDSANIDVRCAFDWYTLDIEPLTDEEKSS